MHELSVATSLVDVVIERLIESGAGRVTRVVVEVGQLSGVVPQALQSAFKVAAAAERGLAGAVLDVREIAVVVYCDACAAERPAVSVQALRCGVCGQPSSRVVRGRELDVVGIEVNDAAPNA